MPSLPPSLSWLSGTFTKRLGFYEQENDDHSLLIELRNFAKLLVYSGRLFEAETATRRALVLTEQLCDQWEEMISLTWLGFVLDRQGRITEALDWFQRAEAIQRRADGEGLHGVLGIR